MRAEITTDGEHILAKIPYVNGRGPDWAKSVPGARWHDESKTWRYPLTMDTCRTFRRIFGAELVVSPALSQWARASIAAGEAIEQLRDGATAVLSRTAQESPFLHAAMMDRKYQISGAAFLCLAGQAILGDEPGLGKTLQTLSALIESDCEMILVVCPRTAMRSVWSRETNRWAPTIVPFVADGNHEQREATVEAFREFPAKRKMLIVNKEMIRAERIELCPDDMQKNGEFWPDGCYEDGHKHKNINVGSWPSLFSFVWDAAILDEAHHLLASRANIQSKSITQGRYGAMLMRRNVKPEGLAIALSGTPARSDLTLLWGSLNWCRPDVWTSFWNYAKTHFGVADGRYSQVIQPDANGKPAKVPVPLDKDAFDASIRPYYLAREKSVAAPDLPEITYVGSPSLDRPDAGNFVWVDMEQKQARAYESMRKMAEARVRNGTLTANGTLAEITRLRQFSDSYGKMSGEDFVPSLPSSKIEWIVQFMEEHRGYDSKVLIASSFTSIVDMIAKVFAKKNIETLTLTGATTDRDRAILVERFNDIDDPVKAAVINTRAGGEAITLDSACDDLIIVDPPWRDHTNQQLEARIHRVSRVHNVFVYRLATPGTVEEWMSITSEEQRNAIRSNKPRARRDAAMEAITWPR